MDRIVGTNNTHQHHQQPQCSSSPSDSDSVVCSLFVLFFFFLCMLLIEIPFKCLGLTIILLLVRLYLPHDRIIIINNLCCCVCVWSAFVAQTDGDGKSDGRTDRQRHSTAATVSPFWIPSAVAIYLIASSFSVLHFVLVHVLLPDLKSKFMFAIKTRSPTPTPSHN